ncbi:MAG: hypothetical protein Q3983_00935 [Capnocytophaga sp.]|nr:hypothetical protein [Capnocytophaga sp.]
MKIYNTLERAGIPFEDIQNVKAFTSTDGFMLVEDEEYEDLQKFFGQFSLFNGLCPLLSDGNSNYWCVFTEGARKGLVCYLNHEEQDRLEPRFKNISRLLVAIEKHPDAGDFDDLNELPKVFDFPANTIEDFPERETIITQLYHEIEQLPDDNCTDQARSSRIYAIITLATASEATIHIKPFLDDEDDYVVEFAKARMKEINKIIHQRNNK